MTRCVKCGLALACLLWARVPAEADVSSQLMVRQGLSQYDHGHYQEALGHFISALQVDPKDEKALYWQGRAASGLSSQRRAQLRRQSLEIVRDGLDQAERVRLAGILCRRAHSALRAGELASAAALYRESHATFARHGCVSVGLIATHQALVRKMDRGEASSEEIQILAEDFSASGDGAWSMAARAQAGRSASAQAGRSASVQAGRPAAFTEPVAEPSWVAVSPQPPVKPAPPAPTAAPTPAIRAPAPVLRIQRKAPAMTIVEALPQTRATPIAPSLRDISASEELYLLGVADYMSNKPATAAASLSKALEFNPDNARAKNLFRRIEQEPR